MDVSNLPLKMLKKIYTARCEDFSVKENESQMKRFIAKLGKSHLNRKLNLSNLGLGPISSREIASLIQRKQKEIAVLDISKNVLGNKGILPLLQVIKNSKTLIAIDIGANEIGPEGMIKVMEALAQNESVTSLSFGSQEALNRNRIEQKGCSQLYKMIRSNTLITILNLHSTNIGNFGVEMIAKGMADESSLISLNLGFNHLTNDCVDSLKQIMAKSNLQELKLNGNKLGNKSMVDLKQSIRISTL